MANAPTPAPREHRRRQEWRRQLLTRGHRGSARFCGNGLDSLIIRRLTAGRPRPGSHPDDSIAIRPSSDRNAYVGARQRGSSHSHRHPPSPRDGRAPATRRPWIPCVLGAPRRSTHRCPVLTQPPLRPARRRLRSWRPSRRGRAECRRFEHCLNRVQPVPEESIAFPFPTPHQTQRATRTILE